MYHYRCHGFDIPSIGQEIITDTTLKFLPDKLQFPHETPTIHKKIKKQYSLPRQLQNPA